MSGQEALEGAALQERIEEARAQGADALAALGTMLRALGMPEAAEGCYHEALERSPASSSARVGLAAVLTELDSRAEMAGDREEAIPRHERALALHPTSSEALYNLGVAWMAERCLERAAFLFEMAFQCDPGRAEAMNNLGIIHQEISGAERAAECYLLALRARPQFPEAMNNLAVVRTAQGRTWEAQLLLEEALRAAVGRIRHKQYGKAKQRLCLSLHTDTGAFGIRPAARDRVPLPGAGLGVDRAGSKDRACAL